MTEAGSFDANIPFADEKEADVVSKNSFLFSQFTGFDYCYAGGEEENHDDYSDDRHEDKRSIRDLWSIDSKGYYRIFDDRFLDDVVSSKSTSTQEPLVRYSTTLGLPGVVRLDLSPLTQKICACVIDENVTTEYPWVYVKKLIIEDNIDLHSDSSDFLPVRAHIESYPDEQVLVGYAPSLDHEGQFYVCATKEAHDAVAQLIQEIRLEQQERVRAAIFKEPSPQKWPSQGSEELIEMGMVRKSRPLYQIEIETSVGQLKAPRVLEDRLPDMQRDGSVELIPHRESFDNVPKALTDNATTVGPGTSDAEAQTQLAMEVNATCQCLLDQEPMLEAAPKLKLKNLNLFLKSRLEEVLRVLKDNEVWDVYANDYASLRRGEELDVTSEFVEEESYTEGKVHRGVVSDISWHPTWSGVVAVAYSRLANADHLKPKAEQKEEEKAGEVLVWAFDDCLKPKLYLGSDKHVSRVAFCPWNGNILIGGCVNGQIVIWDLTGMIEEAETTTVITAAQYDDPKSHNVKPPAATSSLDKSQTDRITKISWLPAHNSVDLEGILRELPPNADPSNYSSQFMTSSLDGTIAFWDLKWQPPAEAEGILKNKKKVQLRMKPPTPPKPLTKSPFNILDEKFRPIYLLHLEARVGVDESLTPVTVMSLRRAILRWKPLDPPAHYRNHHTSFLKSAIARRTFFEVTMQKDPKPLNGIFVGTSSGECGFVTWEGYTYITGAEINKETAKWSWRCGGVHDGPVNFAVRSRFMRDHLVTTGGHVFAIWREDLSRPIFWSKSRVRYTSCDWQTAKPNVIFLGRQDGSVEVWDFFVKSSDPTVSQSVSAKIVAGIYTHKLPLQPHCVAFCDYHGDFRMFLVPKNLTTLEEMDVDLMREFVDREAAKVQEQIERDRLLEEQRRAAEEAEKALKKSVLELSVLELTDTQVSKKTKKSYQERMDELHRKWVSHELDRMQTTILSKKNLVGKSLEEQNAPIIKLRREAREREARKQRILDSAEEYFEQAVKVNFPILAETMFPGSKPKQSPSRENLTLPELVPSASAKTLDRIEYLKKTPSEIYKEYEEMGKQVAKKIRNSVTSRRRSSVPQQQQQKTRKSLDARFK